MSDIPLVRTTEYEIRAEFLWFGAILHADVYVRWGKEVRKRFRRDLENVINGMSCPAYAFQAPSHDPKKTKFIKDTGGVYHHRRLTGDGELADMYLYCTLDRSKVRNPNGKLFQR